MSKVSCGVNVWEMPGNAVISRDMASLRKKMSDKFFKWNCQIFSFFSQNRRLHEDMSIAVRMRYNGTLQSVTDNMRD